MICWAGHASSAEAASAWPALCFPRSLREAEPPRAEPAYGLPLSRGVFIQISHHSYKKSLCSFSYHRDCDSSETLQLKAWPCSYEMIPAPRVMQPTWAEPLAQSIRGAEHLAVFNELFKAQLGRAG